MVASAIQIYEVYKVICRKVSEEQALDAVAAMQNAVIVPVDENLALEAAEIALTTKLAMADALIYATATRSGATLITADVDFTGLTDVVVVT